MTDPSAWPAAQRNGCRRFSFPRPGSGGFFGSAMDSRFGRAGRPPSESGMTPGLLSPSSGDGIGWNPGSAPGHHVCSCSVLLGVGRAGASRARHLLWPNSTGARDRNGLLGSDFLPVFRLQAYSCKLVCYLLYATLNCYIRLRNPLLQRKPQQSCTGAR